MICMLAHKLCISRKSGTGRGGWDHPQGAVHKAAAMLGFKGAMVGTGWAKFCPGCMSRLRKHYSHLVGVHFWQGRLFGFSTADYCMLVNEWPQLKSRGCLLWLKVHLGSAFE